MRKFAGYPIVVNYNLHTRLRSESEEVRLHEGRQYEKERQLSVKTNTTSDAKIENGLYEVELDQYEATVCACLRKIEGNPVGRMVLGLLNKQTTVWIVPESDAELKKCYCAQTGPLNYDIQTDGSYARGAGSGDTVIRFQPELGDDTLLHELVHAYRYSYNKYNPAYMHVQAGQASADENSEEFLAHQMENIYLSQAKRPLKTDYRLGWVADKSEIYDFLLNNTDTLMALKFFLRHEYMAMLAAHSLSADYNPFRDYGMLEAEYRKDGSSALPELGTILSH